MTWQSLTPKGKLTIINGARRDLRGFEQELAHWNLHSQSGHVLWCDGDHGFNPYDFAELNLERGYSAADGADRLLVKRCMTAFQWDTVLTTHLEAKLATTDTNVVVVSPFDRLFTHEELKDWEQEDYVRFVLPYLKDLATRMDVPILLFVDMGRWWQTHPVLAQMAYEAVEDRWSLDAPDGRWRVRNEATGETIDPWLRKQITLVDFEPELRPTPILLRPVMPVTKPFANRRKW